MMNVEITPFAQQQWRKQMRKCEELFGKNVVKKVTNVLIEKIARLSKFPEMGYPEPLLANRPQRFRSIIIQEHYKFIYTIIDNKIQILDFWDMRMNPETLQRRIKN